MSKTSRDSKKVRRFEINVSISYKGNKSSHSLDTEEVSLGYSEGSNHEEESPEPVEVLSHLEEEFPHIIQETPGPNQTATSEDPWGFSTLVSVPKKKKKVVKKTHRPVEVLAE